MNVPTHLMILATAITCLMATIACSAESTDTNSIDQVTSNTNIVDLFERATSLANERCKELYDSEPFNVDDGQIMHSSNQWVWIAIASQGTMDIQAAVTFTNIDDTGTVILEEIVSKTLTLPPINENR